MTRFTTQYGDTGIPLEMRLRSNNIPVNLTAAQSLKIRMTKIHDPDGDRFLDDEDMTPDADQTWALVNGVYVGGRGICRYFWQVADATIPRGLYEATVRLVNSSGQPITFPRDEIGQDYFEITVT